MIYKKENELGYIGIKEKVFEKIIVECAKKYKDNISIIDHTFIPKKIMMKIRKKPKKAGIEISHNENGIDIRIYIVLKKRINISLITDSLIKEVYDRILYTLKFEPKSVAVIVTEIEKN